MFLDLLDLFADPTWSCRGQWIKLGPNCKEEKTVKLNPVTLVIIFTGRNEVVAKVIFLHLSVILFTGGGGSASVHAGIQPAPPPGSRHPPGADTPPREADSGIRSISGRYASYWNAFLLAKEASQDFIYF